jgi:hypothetical protein
VAAATIRKALALGSLLERLGIGEV